MIEILESMLVTVMVCGSLLALAGLYVALYWVEDDDDSTPSEEKPAPEGVKSTQHDSHSRQS